MSLNVTLLCWAFSGLLGGLLGGQGWAFALTKSPLWDTKSPPPKPCNNRELGAKWALGTLKPSQNFPLLQKKPDREITGTYVKGKKLYARKTAQKPTLTTTTAMKGHNEQ